MNWKDAERYELERKVAILAGGLQAIEAGLVDNAVTTAAAALRMAGFGEKSLTLAEELKHSGQ